jgi:hypothetical protein
VENRPQNKFLLRFGETPHDCPFHFFTPFHLGSFALRQRKPSKPDIKFTKGKRVRGLSISVEQVKYQLRSVATFSELSTLN